MKIIEKLENGRVRVHESFPNPSLTQQHFKDECDINNIIKKYKTDGEFTHLNRKKGVYADLSSATDYHEAMNTVIKAQDAFATLPSQTRSRFENDPSQLLAFINDEANYEEAIKLGLMDDIKIQNRKQKQTQTTQTTQPTQPTQPTQNLNNQQITPQTPILPS